MNKNKKNPITGFTLEDLFSTSKISFQLDARKKHAIKSPINTQSTLDIETDSAIFIYKMQKNGWKIMDFNLSPLNLHYSLLYKEKEVIVFFSGMDVRCPLHYAIVTDALLVPNSFIRGRVHQGFINIFEKIWPFLQQNLEKICEKCNKKLSELQISCVGHSMGGAVAMIAGYALKKLSATVSVITFGSPRLFSPIAAREFNKSINCLRITHGCDDPIVALAPMIAGYEHVGQLLELPSVAKSNGGFRHSMLSYLEGVSYVVSHPEFFSQSYHKGIIYKIISPLKMMQEMTLGGVEMMMYDGGRHIIQKLGK